MASDLISEHLFSKFFWGGMPPDPPSISMLHMLIVLRTMEHFLDALGVSICFASRSFVPPLPSDQLYLILTPPLTKILKETLLDPPCFSVLWLLHNFSYFQCDIIPWGNFLSRSNEDNAFQRILQIFTQPQKYLSFKFLRAYM